MKTTASTLMTGDYTRPLDDPETGGTFGAQRLVQGTASLVAARTGLEVRAVQVKASRPWSYSLTSDTLGFTTRSALTGRAFTRGEGMALTVHEIGHRMHTAPFDSVTPPALARYLYRGQWFGWINGAEDVRMERLQAADWPGFLAVRPGMLIEALDHRFTRWEENGAGCIDWRTDPVFPLMAIHGLAGEHYADLIRDMADRDIFPAIPACGEWQNAPAEYLEDPAARREYWGPRFITASDLFAESVTADTTEGMFPALAAAVLALFPSLPPTGTADPDEPGEDDYQSDPEGEEQDGDWSEGEGDDDVQDGDTDPSDMPGSDRDDDPEVDDRPDSGGGGGDTGGEDAEGEGAPAEGRAEDSESSGDTDDDDDPSGHERNDGDEWRDPQQDRRDGHDWIHEDWRQNEIDEMVKAQERDRKIAGKGKHWGKTRADRAAQSAGFVGQWIGDATAAPQSTPTGWQRVGLPGGRDEEGRRTVREAVAETATRNVKALRKVLDANAAGSVQRRTRRGRLDRRRAGRIVTHADPRIFQRDIAPDGITDWALFLAIDTSGSMGPHERREAVGIVVSLLDAAKRMQGVHVGGCTYDSRIAACYPPGTPVDVVDWTSAIMYSSGGTEESRALDVAYWSLMDHGHPGKIALILTDGVPSDPADCHRRAAAMHAMGIITVGIGISGATPDYHPYWASVPTLTDLPATLTRVLAHVMSGGGPANLSINNDQNA